jgi:hypothetical protein
MKKKFRIARKQLIMEGLKPEMPGKLLRMEENKLE